MNPYVYSDVKTCFKLQRNRKNRSWQQYDARFESAGYKLVPDDACLYMAVVSINKQKNRWIIKAGF